MQRNRRLRIKQSLIDITAENQLNVNDFVFPLFVKEGNNIKNEIPSMPGQYHYSVDNLAKEIEDISNLGLKSVLLFGIPNHKTEDGSSSFEGDGVVQQAIKVIKATNPKLTIMTDVCVCSYTSSGHCGILNNEKGIIDNDLSIELLAKMALSHAQAGADVVAPSAMMDFQVESIREILDLNHFENTAIMGYSAKYYSSCYGPFREAADSAPQFGNRSSYQMDIRNSKEAILEAENDILEGADIIMVKPAMLFLDIIKELSQNFNHPIAAYNVSGEYSMLKAAAEKGWINEKAMILEMATAIKRAGAKINITYFAKELAKIIKDIQ